MATQYPPDFSKVENLLQDIAHKSKQEKNAESKKQHWHQTWWGQLASGLIITIVGGIALALIL